MNPCNKIWNLASESLKMMDDFRKLVNTHVTKQQLYEGYRMMALPAHRRCNLPMLSRLVCCALPVLQYAYCVTYDYLVCLPVQLESARLCLFLSKQSSTCGKDIRGHMWLETIVYSMINSILRLHVAFVSLIAIPYI